METNRPPETLGTQYANLTRSGSSLIFGATVMWTPFVTSWPTTVWAPLEVLYLLAGILNDLGESGRMRTSNFAMEGEVKIWALVC